MMDMDFQTIPPVEKPKEMLDAAFGAARQKAGQIKKSKAKRMEYGALQQEKLILRIQTVKKVLTRRLRKIVSSFPSLNSMMPFYQKLLRCYVDTGMVRKCLGAVDWASTRIEKLSREYEGKARKNRDNSKYAQIRQAYYGRISSTLNQIADELLFLEEVRSVLRTFPTLKETFTICIAGFPNVGKSTLLKRLSGAEPEIAAYAFTTKSLNVGYMEGLYGWVQLVDTPGTLNRKDRMNDVELQAHIALQELADAVVYVYDLTEPWPLEKQEKLLKRIQKLKKPIILYVSKHDIIPERVEKFCADRGAHFDIEKLKHSIREMERESYARNQNFLKESGK